MSGPTVLCVLRSGGDFLPEHVEHLYQAVRHHAAGHVRFVVLSDVPLYAKVEQHPLRTDWPRWWAKMELFDPVHQQFGDLLYLDLDTVIVGDLADVLKVRALTVLTDFQKPNRIGSGLMFIPAEERPMIWSAFTRDPARAMRTSPRGDQQFLEACGWQTAERWQDLRPHQVISYKQHVQRRRRIPKDARVICFHGQPRPWATALWKK